MKAFFTKQMGRSLLLRKSLSSLLGLVFLFGMQNKAIAQPIDLLFNPSITTVQVGQTFTIDVLIDFNSAATFDAVGAFINFNNLDLELVSTPTVPSATATALPNQVPFAPVATVNATGQLDYTRFTTDAGPTSDLVFFTATFRALRVPPGGQSILAFNVPAPRESGAYSGGTNVSNVTATGVVNVTTAGACGGTLANVGSCNGDFNLSLINTTGTGPYDLVINGTTYSNIIPNTQFSVTPVAENFFGNSDPGSAEQNDASVELGMKFSSSQDGYIYGVRFFAPSIATGTYTGHLWSQSGTLLATATFTGIAGRDWYEANFATPVFITANTTYIASYFTSAGRYTATNFFFTAPFTNGASLTAPQGAGNGLQVNGNGLFSYGFSSSVPDSSYFDGNYYVDVNFVPASSAFSLTSLSDAVGCVVTGAPLQNLVVISPDCSTLPVTLLNLSASPQDNKITLRWSTASELNNTGFRVQRSTEAGNARWEDLGFVAGAGTTTTTSNYSYVDNNLSPRRYYYRLMQIDIDGQAKFTPVVSATINGKGESLLEQNFPNPFRNETTTIRFTLPRTTQVMLSIFDMNGRLVKVLVNGKKDAGTHAIPFSAGSLGSGVYYYKLQAGDFTDVKKMTIQ